MALVLKDRVKQTAAAPGTGTITLGATASGFQSFSAIGNGNVTYFAIVDAASGAWEVNYGTYTASGTTLTRNATPLSSSTGGALVNFTGAVDVFVTYPSENAVWRDTSGVVAQQSFGAITATSAALTTGTVSTTPNLDIDIANKQYVDTVATSGLHFHEAVFVESPNTVGNLNATYANGGTNANIIQIANGTDITFFSVTPSIGDQFFIGSSSNGLIANTPYYIVADLGSGTYQISLTYGGSDVTGLTNGSPTIPSVINPGIGATLTNAGAQVALTIDGVLMTVGKRVLVYNQTNGFENGVYTVTTVGTVSTNWVLTRATDADTYSPSTATALGQGDAFFVTDGDTGAGETYAVTTSGDIFFGITAINFAQISSAQVYNAGTGLTLSPATTFNIANTTVSANTYGSAAIVPVFAVNAQGQLTSVTNTNIAINGSAVTGAISGQAGSVANALTLGTYLTGTSFNGSSAVTATVDATSANTASKVVARDASGNFSAGTITATLSGNATNVSGTVAIANGGSGTTTAQGAMNAFAGAVTSGSYLRGNGSDVVMSTIQVADVPTLNQNTTGNATTATTATNLAGGSAGTVPYQSAAGTTAMLAAGSSGQVLQSNGAAAPSWVSPNDGTLTMAVSGTGLSGSATFTANQAGASSFTVTSNATNANTASAIVARDASGNFSAGTITAALSGNATNVTGTVAVANGGTGATTLTANNVVLGNGTSAVQFVAPGTTGNVLTSNGTTWTSAAGGFPTGTVMLFVQTAAPTGWTKSTTHDNKALRVVSGSASSGGTTAFTSVFTNQTVSTSVSISGTSGATTLSTSQIPSHQHSANTFYYQDLSGPDPDNRFNEAGPLSDPGPWVLRTLNVNAEGGGSSHTHSFSGSGSGTSSAVTLNVAYVDVIIATKN
jgi:hypothetical protein